MGKPCLVVRYNNDNEDITVSIRYGGPGGGGARLIGNYANKGCSSTTDTQYTQSDSSCLTLHFLLREKPSQKCFLAQTGREESESE